MRLKIHFESEARPVKILSTKFNSKSIGDDNLKIAAYLYFYRFMKN